MNLSRRAALYAAAGGFARRRQCGPLHYLKAVKELGVAQAKAYGRKVAEMLKKLPTVDNFFGEGLIREDGRKIHPADLFEVRKPLEVDGFVITASPPQPRPSGRSGRGEGGCPLVKT